MGNKKWHSFLVHIDRNGPAKIWNADDLKPGGQAKEEDPITLEKLQAFKDQIKRESSQKFEKLRMDKNKCYALALVTVIG